MRTTNRQTWWLLASLLLFIPWLAPPVQAQEFSDNGHDFTLTIDPVITDNTITLNYTVNNTEGVTLRPADPYNVRTWLDPAVEGVTNPNASNTQTGELKYTGLTPGYTYHMNVECNVYPAEGEGHKISGNLVLTTTNSGSTTDPDEPATVKGFKVKVEEPVIGVTTVDFTYQYYYVMSDDREVAITEDNIGDTQITTYFAWNNNDEAQKTTYGQHTPSGTYTCLGLTANTGYALYHKFYANDTQLWPDGFSGAAYDIRTLEQTLPEPGESQTFFDSTETYSITFTPQAFQHSINLDYTVNLPDGENEADYSYQIEAEIVTPTSSGVKTLTDKEGTFVFDGLDADTKHMIYARAYIDKGTVRYPIILDISDATHQPLYVTTTDTGGDLTVTGYKVKVAEPRIGKTTIEFDYQYYYVMSDGSEVAITTENQGETTFTTFFAWESNDAEQEKTYGQHTPSGTYICYDLVPGKTYDLYHKFNANGNALTPEGVSGPNYNLTTLSDAAAVYAVKFQQRSGGENPYDVGDAIAMVWDAGAGRYSHNVTAGTYFLIRAYNDAGNEVINFAAAPNDNTLDAAVRKGLTNANTSAAWDFSVAKNGVLYIYTVEGQEGALPTEYEFVPDGPGYRYYAVLGTPTVTKTTVTFPYTFYKQLDGEEPQEVTAEDNLKLEAYFAWNNNDTEQHAKASTTPSGTFVCEGLEAATTYQLYPKFLVNDAFVFPPTDEIQYISTEGNYTIYVQKYDAEGVNPLEDGLVELEWDNEAMRYVFEGDPGYYKAVAMYEDDRQEYGLNEGNELFVYVGRSGILNPGNPMNFKVGGTMYLYTAWNVKGNLIDGYEFLARQADTTGVEFAITDYEQVDDEITTFNQARIIFNYTFTVPEGKQVTNLLIGVIADDVNQEAHSTWIFMDKPALYPCVGIQSLGAFGPGTHEKTATITLNGLSGNPQIAYVYARVDFGDEGGEADLDVLDENEWELTHGQGEVMTKPEGIQTMDKLTGVNKTWYSGKIIHAEIVDGEVIYQYPTSVDQEGAEAGKYNGMSGNYVSSKLADVGDFNGVHYAPDIFYSIGNHEKGYMVGIVNYPLPLPTGFVPAVKINNNLTVYYGPNDNGKVWLDKDGKTVAANTPDAKEYQSYWFSTKYVADFQASWDMPVTYVNNSTVSYSFGAMWAGGGSHGSRTFTYRTEGSQRLEHKSVAQKSQEMGSDAIEIYHVDALPPTQEWGDEGKDGWSHTAIPQDYAYGMYEDGTWGTDYAEVDEFWHPAFDYALGNNSKLANTEKGSPFTMVVKFEEGTVVPADLIAHFYIHEFIDEPAGSQPADARRRAVVQRATREIASGDMTSSPDEINLYSGQIATDNAGNPLKAGKEIGVTFKFEYTPVRPGNSFSDTTLRSYYVTDDEDKGIHTGIESVSVEESDAPVEYFNLQGVRVENPSNGIFIRRQGNKVAKVAVR